MQTRLKKLKTNENILIAVDVLLHSKGSFNTAFLLAFMIDISLANGSVNYIIYTVLGYIGFAVTALLFMRFMKKHMALSWRLGILFSAVKILAIILIGNQIVDFLYIIIILNALETTLYWQPYSFYSVSEVSNERRLSFEKRKNVLGNIIKIVCPFMLGFLIQADGYINTAVAILVITAIQLLLTLLFRPEKTKSLRPRKLSLNLRAILKYESTRRVVWLQFWRGVLASGSALYITSTILVYVNSGSELDLGLFTTIGSILAILVITLYCRTKGKLKTNRTRLVFWAVVGIVTFIVQAIIPSLPFYVVGYVVSIAVIESLFNMSANVTAQNNIRRDTTLSRYYLEMGIIGEVALNTGRCLALFALLAVICFSGNTYLTLFAAINIFAVIPLTILISRYKSGAENSCGHVCP